MNQKTNEHAHQLIKKLQEELSMLRKSTYTVVHDEIGSTISAASIKAKILVDKVTDSYEKKQLTEIHGLIRETMEKVTTLNKKLKTGWIPQSSETLFNHLKSELEKMATQFGIQIDFKINGSNNMGKLDFAVITSIQEWAQNYFHNAVSRIAQKIVFSADIQKEKIDLAFSDDAPIATDSKTTLTVPTKGEK